MNASMCKGKVSFKLPSRPCFPGVQGTPSSGCRKPLSARRKSREGFKKYLEKFQFLQGQYNAE